jgi:small GTP-binding protein
MSEQEANENGDHGAPEETSGPHLLGGAERGVGGGGMSGGEISNLSENGESKDAEAETSDKIPTEADPDVSETVESAEVRNDDGASGKAAELEDAPSMMDVSTDDDDTDSGTEGTFTLERMMESLDEVGNISVASKPDPQDGSTGVASHHATKRRTEEGLQQIKEKVKVIFIGSAGVGKTTLLKVLHGHTFEETLADTVATIGIDYYVLKFQMAHDIEIELELWDTAGQERYSSVMESYFRSAQGSCCIFVYDGNEESSFKGLDTWVNRVENAIGKQYAGVVIGNKADLPSTVSLDDGIEYAAQYGMVHCTCSAKNKISVEKALQDVLSLYVKRSKSPDFFSSSQRRGNSSVELASKDSLGGVKDDAEEAKVLGCC